MLPKIKQFSLVGIILLSSIFPTHKTEEKKNISYPLPTNISVFQKVRVLIGEGSSEIQFSTKTPFEIWDNSGRLFFKGNDMVNMSVKAVDDGIKFGSQILKGDSAWIESKGSGIEFKKRTYEGAIKLLVKGKKLLVINELYIDDYLQGVIPFEANPKWPLSSLKAQAIAARTYTIFRAIENSMQEFDVHSSVISQAYVGKKIKHERTDRAIIETEGAILLYKGEVFPAFYHSTCGGQTARVDKVWPVKRHPSLSGVKCTFCEGSKHYIWKKQISLKEIEKKLKAKGFSVLGITKIDFKDFDKAGYAHTVVIYSREGKKVFNANEFRLWIGPEKIKSTLITRASMLSDGYVVLRGRGWGHGVGMCQYGMKRLGELGYDYREILSQYYPQSEIVRIKELIRK